MAGAFVFHFDDRVISVMTARDHRSCHKVSRRRKKEQQDREKAPNPVFSGTMHGKYWQLPLRRKR